MRTTTSTGHRASALATAPTTYRPLPATGRTSFAGAEAGPVHRLRRVAVAAAVAASLTLAGAPGHAEEGDAEPEGGQTPVASIVAGATCEYGGAGPGIVYSASLDPAPEEGTVVPHVDWRPVGEDLQTIVGQEAGFISAGDGDYELRARYLVYPPKGKKAFPPVPVVQHHQSDWVPVTVDCDGDDGDPGGDDGGDDGGGNPGGDDSGTDDEIRDGDPNFTG